MHARDYAIHDGAGRWFPVALRRIPDSPQLDDMIVLDIAFPPGSHSGPPVALPDMDRLSVESAPRWRAYIAAQSVAWLPGKTLVPVPRTSRFVWTRNLAAYPVLTLPDRQRFAFGLGDRKHRTRAEIDAAFPRPARLGGGERIGSERTDRGCRMDRDSRGGGACGARRKTVNAQPGKMLRNRGKCCATGEFRCATGEFRCATGESRSPVAQAVFPEFNNLRVSFSGPPPNPKGGRGGALP